jgi:hypothetical protein
VHEGRGRVFVDLVRGAGLLDAALVHDHDAVGDLERLFDVVRDEDGGDVDLVVQPPQPLPQLLAHLGVQRPEGLVQQQHLGLDREGAREGHALALAARELRGIAVPQRVELHQAQQVVDALFDDTVRRAHRARLHAQAEGDVLEHGHVPEQRVVLEDEADAAVAGVDGGRVLAVEEHLAGVGLLQPRDDAQQAGLARTRGAQQGDELAGRKLHAHVAQGLEGAEALVDVAGLDAHVVSGAVSLRRDSSSRRARHSTRFFSSSVATAMRASSAATAKAGAKAYSL